MDLFSLFGKRKEAEAPRLVDKNKYRIKLYNQSGTVFTVNDVSGADLEIFKNNIGRDYIFIDNGLIVNLKDFNVAQVESSQ